jgi:hypothetical protein
MKNPNEQYYKTPSKSKIQNPNLISKPKSLVVLVHIWIWGFQEIGGSYDRRA